MQWFGDAEKLTKALFSFASRLAPVIIFIDEVSLVACILFSALADVLGLLCLVSLPLVIF